MPKFLFFALSLMAASLVLLLHPLTDAQGEQSAAATAAKQQGTVPAAKAGAPVTASAPAKSGAPATRSAKAAAKDSVAAPAKKPGGTVQLSAQKIKRAPQTRGTGKAVSPGKQPASTQRAAPLPQTKKAQNAPQRMGKDVARPAAAANSAPADSAPLGIEQQISARSAIILDAETGKELFAKYPDNPRQPASTIKIVTAMIAIKSLKNSEIVDISDHAASMPSSKVFLETSKQYQTNDLINAVLLASANDASVALAERIAGSEENFANLMTISARLWGARNTVCRTASGLTALGQQSTSRDLANIFRYAMRHDEFAKRMREKFITTSYGKVLRNHNKALWRLDGALGGKTGYTVAARQTYVGQFSRDKQTIVVALMGSETMWADLAKLVEYGFKKQKDEQLAQTNGNTTD